MVSRKLCILALSLHLLFGDQTASAAPTKNSNQAAIRLAVTVPLSGDFATYGQQIRQGVELAQAEQLERGRTLEISFADVCFPQSAINALQHLVQVKKIQAIAANFCLLAIPPMSPLIAQHKIVTMHVASVSDSILNAGDYILSTNVKVRDEAYMLANYAYEKLGAKNASVIAIATDFGEDYNTYFTSRFEGLGGNVVSFDRVAPGNNEFRAEMLRIKAHQPDVILIAHLGPALGTILKQREQLGISAPVLSVYEAEDPSVLAVAGKSAEGLRFFTPDPNAASESVKVFRRKFYRRFHDEPRLLATNAYDATMIVVDALSTCSGDTTCARDKIYQLRDYPGASGAFSFDADGGTKRSLVLKSVRNGKFVID